MLPMPARGNGLSPRSQLRICCLTGAADTTQATGVLLLVVLVWGAAEKKKRNGKSRVAG